MRPHTATTTRSKLPVATLTEAMSYLRITDASEAQMVEALLGTAVAFVEDITGRAAMRQTITLTGEDWHHLYDCADARTIPLPHPPLASVVAVRYFDAVTQVSTVWDSSNYIVVTTREPGFLQRTADATWPDVDDRADAIQIQYLAGPANHGDRDATLWVACLLVLSELYENRASSEKPTREWLENYPQLKILLMSLRSGGYCA